MNYEPEVYSYIKKKVASNNDLALNVYALVDISADEKNVPILFNIMPDSKGGE